MDQRLDQDVVDVLSRAGTQGAALRLPPERLDRELYERVNKALENLGGKWNKKARAHIFPTDAQPKLAAMLNSGVSVDEKKRDQAFFTPPDLASDLVEMADVRGRNVLEPSAGQGVLVDACMAAGATVVCCVEINAEMVAALRIKYPSTVVHGDFLTIPPPAKPPYERIVMNPPFTKNQDIAHVKHALKWLAPGGILVSLMMPNQNRKGFQEIVEKYDPEIIEVGRGAFKESGTNIATIIVKIQIARRG